MLESARTRLLESLDAEAVVLDIGGWADPFERADWVLDLMPYDTRGLYEREGWIEPRDRGPERFTRETWVERDICDREPYPFEDGSMDFVICSQTLEDIRDPVWVCSEMGRIAKAGYIEVPSRLEEQSWGVMGRGGVGWPHHRWLIDVRDGAIDFLLKPHPLQTRRDLHFAPGFWSLLSEEERVETLWWEGDLVARERMLVDEAETDANLREVIARGLEQHPLPAGPGARARRLAHRIGLRLARG